MKRFISSLWRKSNWSIYILIGTEIKIENILEEIREKLEKIYQIKKRNEKCLI